jgi:hypothetical protein
MYIHITISVQAFCRYVLLPNNYRVYYIGKR